LISLLTKQRVIVGGVAAAIAFLALITVAGLVWLRPGPAHAARGRKDGSPAGPTLARRSPSTQPKAKLPPSAPLKQYVKSQPKNVVSSPQPRQKNDQTQPNRKAGRSATDITKQAPTNTARESALPEKGSNLDAALKQSPGQIAPQAGPSALLTLEAVLDEPGKFRGKPITTDGLYTIGTRTLSVKDADGKPIGRSIQVTRTDGATVSSGESKAMGRDAYLLLQEGFIPTLESVLLKLKFQIRIQAEHRSILTVAVRSTSLERTNTPIVEIVGMEILGSLDMMKIVEGQYDKAFSTVRITRGNAKVGHGQGDTWVELMGGEEKFVLPVRQQVMALQRRMRNLRDTAMLDRYLQEELTRTMMLADIAQQQQQARMFTAMMGRRVLP